MERATRMVDTALRWATAQLPPGRRDWAEAARTEAAQLPIGPERFSWMAGTLRVVLREAGMARRSGLSLLGVGAGAVLVWLGWHPGSENPGMPANRVTLAAVVALVVVLPWVTATWLGPVADNRTARTVRAGGFAAMYALLAVIVGLSRFAGSRFDHFGAFDQANWESEMRSGAVISAVIVVTLLGAYLTMILALTSRRAAVLPATLRRSVGLGAIAALSLYALMPLGNPLHLGNRLGAAAYGMVLVAVPVGVVLAAGIVAGRRVPASRTRIGVVAGLCAGGTAALIVAVLTIATMLLLPRQVDLEWANPDPYVAHGTAYEVQMSVGDAAIKYELGLLVGPLLGLVLGAIGGTGLAGDVVPAPVVARREEEPATVLSR